MKIANLLKFSALGLVAVGSVTAATFNLSPTPADLYDLDHYYAYTWGISSTQFTVPSGQVITGASLSFSNIRNWKNETNALFIHLLDSAPAGVTSTWEGNTGASNISDYFTGQGILLTTFVDSTFVSQNYTYTFTPSALTSLINYYNNGQNFALGFDPDCHYYNDGIKLTITTGAPPSTTGVPDSGSSLILLGLGLLGLAGLKRRMVA